MKYKEKEICIVIPYKGVGDIIFHNSFIKSISKFYNFKPGSVCKIIRKSPTNINSTSYRIIK